MAFTVMVFANRKQGVTHEAFKNRYEQHMLMISDLCGDAAPLSHSRFYPKHESTTDKPNLLAGDAEDNFYSVVVVMGFKDEEAWQRFCTVLGTESTSKKVLDDEAGFWERERMKVVAVERCGN